MELDCRVPPGGAVKGAGPAWAAWLDALNALDGDAP